MPISSKTLQSKYEGPTLADVAFSCIGILYRHGVVAGKDHVIAEKLGVDRKTLKKYEARKKQFGFPFERGTMKEDDGTRTPAIRFGSYDDAFEVIQGWFPDLGKKDIKSLRGNFREIKNELLTLGIFHEFNTQRYRMDEKKKEKEKKYSKHTDLKMIVVPVEKLARKNKCSKSTVRRNLKDLQKQKRASFTTINRYFRIDDMRQGLLMLKELAAYQNEKKLLDHWDDKREHGIYARVKSIGGHLHIWISLGTVVTAFDSYKESAYVRYLREKMIPENLWYMLRLETPLQVHTFNGALKTLKNAL